MDTNFIFSCSTRYLTRSLRSLVKYRAEHEKIKFVSTSGHVIFCLLYKQQYQGYFSNFPRFPNIFQGFPKIFENSPNTALSSYEHFRSFSENFRRCPKIFKDYQRLPNISEQSSKMLGSSRNEFRSVLQLNLINLIAHTMSLLSSHVKI